MKKLSRLPNISLEIPDHKPTAGDLYLIASDERLTQTICLVTSLRRMHSEYDGDCLEFTLASYELGCSADVRYDTHRWILGTGNSAKASLWNDTVYLLVAGGQ